MPPKRPPRSDSQRNRAGILRAARELYTSSDADVPMTAVAARAEVAVGTLYNHFPTKADLLSAVVAEFTGEIATSAETFRDAVQAGQPADEALGLFLNVVLDASAANRAIKAAARQLGAGEIAGSPDEQRAAEALEAILRAGIDHQAIRPGIAVEDIYLLVNSAPLDHPKQVRARWLDLITHGLRTQPSD